LYEAIQNDPCITREDLLAEVDYKVKANSIWRLTHEMGLRKWRKLNRPYLTPIHAAKRLAWALTYRHFTPEDWKRVFWSDETTIERGQGARKEWKFIPPKRQLEERDKGVQMTLSKGKQTKQMFWACFSGAPRKTGLIPLFGDPTATRKGITKEVVYNLYRGILPTLLANEDAIFQHDNAPTHTAYIVQQLLREMNITVMDCPPYSPDLNPIENLWGLLKADILKLRPWLREMPNNNETWAELVDAAQAAWEQLTIRHFINLAETMPHRVEEVILYEGWHTSY
jgi:transposase